VAKHRGMTEHQWKDQKGTWFHKLHWFDWWSMFPLAFAPIVNGKDYYTRKGDYAITGLVIFEDS